MFAMPGPGAVSRPVSAAAPTTTFLPASVAPLGLPRRRAAAGIATGQNTFGRLDGPSSPVIPVQFEPEPPERRAPGGRFLTPDEEIRGLRFSAALDVIRRLEPNNPQLTSLRDPDRTIPEETVRRLEHEAELARQRNVVIDGRVLPVEPPEKRANDAAPVEEKRELVPRGTYDILSPGGKLLEFRSGRAAPRARTVLPQEFSNVPEDLMVGAKELPQSDYPGRRFIRPDGSEFGLRISPGNGLTIDVRDPKLLKDLELHQLNGGVFGG